MSELIGRDVDSSGELQSKVILRSGNQFNTLWTGSKKRSRAFFSYIERVHLSGSGE